MVDASKNGSVELETAVLIPLATIAVEVGQSVEWVANQFAGHIQLDPVGLRGVPPTAAMEFFAARWERRKKDQADHARRSEELAAKGKLRVAAVPAIEGASPVESLRRAEAEAGTYSTPSQDFDELGREPPTFLADQLAEGQREMARRRQETAARKEAAAAAMKDQLGGKP